MGEHVFIAYIQQKDYTLKKEIITITQEEIEEFEEELEEGETAIGVYLNDFAAECEQQFMHVVFEKIK